MDEFMAWQKGRAGRYELYDGRAVRMQAERNIHSIVKANVKEALARRLVEAGVDCTALADGPTVAIDEAHGFVPDASVQCGPIDLDSVYNDNPVVVVEVISPGSRRRGRSRRAPDRARAGPGGAPRCRAAAGA